MCIMCKNNVIDSSLFKQTAYGNNPIVTKLLIYQEIVIMLCAKSITQNCGITALLNAFCVVTTL